MAFDASPLATIGDNFDPTAAKAKAYQLKDLLDEQQLNQLKLGQEKQKAADTATARKILSKADISTPEGMIKAAQSLNQAGLSDQGMGLIKEAQSSKLSESQLQESHLNLIKASSDILGPAAIQIAQTFQTQGPAMARAQYQQLVGTVLPRLPEDLRQRIPAQAPADDKQFMQLLQGTIQQSQQARSILQSRRQDEQLRLAENRDQRAEEDERRKESKEADRKREEREGIISDDSAQLAVDRILNGEQARDVLANFGRGKQGANNITKVQNLLAQTAKDRGVSSQEITARMVEFKGLVKEQQVEASISGKISYAEKEIEQIGPKVIEAANKIGRGQFVPWNKLRNMAASQISDPNLKQLKAYLNTLTNSYDVLGGRGGTDVEKRAHNRELLDAADSPEAIKAAVDAITQEAALSHTAAQESRTVDRDSLGGGPQKAPGGDGKPTVSNW